MEVYRICSEKYAHELTASGRPNRWNYQREYVIYTTATRALATLELVAHRNAIMEGINYKVLCIEIPDDPSYISTIPPKTLAADWTRLKFRHLTQDLGSRWYSSKKSVVIQVPSALIPQENNYIINTLHPDYKYIRIAAMEDFVWDSRLLDQ